MNEINLKPIFRMGCFVLLVVAVILVAVILVVAIYNHVFNAIPWSIVGSILLSIFSIALVWTGFALIFVGYIIHLKR